MVDFKYSYVVLYSGLIKIVLNYRIKSDSLVYFSAHFMRGCRLAIQIYSFGMFAVILFLKNKLNPS
jgi:hypothetical protein